MISDFFFLGNLISLGVNDELIRVRWPKVKGQDSCFFFCANSFCIQNILRDFFLLVKCTKHSLELKGELIRFWQSKVKG